MKTLQNYIEAEQTKLFNETGAFFAFSKKQFDEQKKEGVIYTDAGAGCICPTDKVKMLVDGLESIHKAGIAQDIAENGIDKIIARELANYEAYYTYEIDDTVDALEDYGITREQVQTVFDRIAPTVEV